MKLANLWFYFLGGPAVNAGAAEYTFDEDAVGTVIAPAVVTVEEDSRGWRYHAHALVGQVRGRSRLARTTVSASASAPVRGVRGLGHVANASAKASSRPQAAPVRGRASVRAVQVAASAGPLQAVVRAARGRVGQASGAAGSFAEARSTQARGRVSSAEVSIGPDLVEQELEEIMFLLEVA